MRLLATEIRLRHNRKANPTMVMIDGQTVKGGRAGPTFHEAGGRGGYTRGAKRSILIEILGLPLAVQVDSAKPHDVQAARAFLAPQLDANHPTLPGLKAIVADRGSTGLAGARRQAQPRARHQVPARAGPAATQEARRQAEEGSARVHAAAPALQGREHLGTARHVAAAVMLLRGDRPRREDLAGGRCLAYLCGRLRAEPT
jgi:Transposase DDE domain